MRDGLLARIGASCRVVFVLLLCASSVLAQPDVVPSGPRVDKTIVAPGGEPGVRVAVCNGGSATQTANWTVDARLEQTPDGQYLVDWWAWNIGPGDAGAFQTTPYLSLDETLDGEDTFLGYIDRSGLPAGGETGGTVGPWSLPSCGTWYVLLVVDSNNDVAEGNKSNNTDVDKAEFIQGDLIISATVDWDWVYQNTQTTTQDRHLSVLAVTLDQEAVPGEAYDVEFTEDGGPVTNFKIEPTGVPDQYNILGGRIRASTPNPGAASSYTIGVKYTGQTSGQVAAATVLLQLRLLGDITGDGDVGGDDQAQMNRRQNTMAVSYGDRSFDLNGDTVIDGDDKAVMNRMLNSMQVR